MTTVMNGTRDDRSLIPEFKMVPCNTFNVLRKPRVQHFLVVEEKSNLNSMLHPHVEVKFLLNINFIENEKQYFN